DPFGREAAQYMTRRCARQTEVVTARTIPGVQGAAVLDPFLHPNAHTPRVGGPGFHPNAHTPRVGGPGVRVPGCRHQHESEHKARITHVILGFSRSSRLYDA